MSGLADKVAHLRQELATFAEGVERALERAAVALQAEPGRRSTPSDAPVTLR